MLLFLRFSFILYPQVVVKSPFFVEYGLPSTSAEKLLPYIDTLSNEAEIIDRIKKLYSKIIANWMPYEIEQLQRCL